MSRIAPMPSNVSGVKIPDRLNQLVDNLAKNEYAANVYLLPDPINPDFTERDIVYPEFEELDEPEKMYFKETATRIIKYILKSGYKITEV